MCVRTRKSYDRVMSDTPTSADDRAARAWGALLHVHATLVPVLDRELQRSAGISLAWYDVLLELHAASGHQLRMTELGQRVVLSRTRVSRLVDEMATSGMVRREANSDDKRSSFAVLTDVGRAAFIRAAPTYLDGIERHFGSHLDDAELSTVGAALWRVHEEEKS